MLVSESSGRLTLFASGPFRFAALLSLIFAVGTACLVGILSLAVDHYARELASDTICTEMTIISDEYRTRGQAHTAATVKLRENAVREKQLRYLLINARGEWLAGDLPLRSAKLGNRIFDFPEHEVEDEDEHDVGTVRYLIRGQRLPDGSRLILGFDLYDIDQFAKVLRWATALFGTLICVIALIGGLLVGRTFLSRLDDVNNAIGRIMNGRLNERLPSIGFGGEFKRLTGNLNRMLDRIERLVDSVRQVSTDIAHDLRTPLTRLRQRLEHLQAQNPDGELGDQLEATLQQADEIITIFATLLRIGNLEAQASALASTPVDLSALLERIVETYAPVADDMDHVISRTGVIADLVSGDKALLVQAVTNLLDNALAHTPPGSHIRVRTEDRGETVALIVEDDGPGIPVDQREKVVRRFYRLDRSRFTPGSGLGLAIVDAVARMHGAPLVLEDAQPGLRTILVLQKVPQK